MSSAWTTREIDAPIDDMMDAHTVAKLFGVSKDTLDKMVKDGEFPAPLVVGKAGKVWEWRAVTYYRLRLEFLPRISANFPATDG